MRFTTMTAEEIIRIFLSHAGPDKRDFVDFLYTLLKEALLSVNVFLDQHSLKYSSVAAERMEKAVHEACVGKTCLWVCPLSSASAIPSGDAHRLRSARSCCSELESAAQVSLC
jgi:hypothetical protein